MIVVSIHYLEGTSKKTGKPYQCHKVSGIERDYYNGGLKCSDYMISPAEFARHEIEPGMNIEVFRSGEVMIKDTNCFDMKLLEAALDMPAE